VERLNNTQYSTVYSIGRYKDGEDPVVSVMNFANWSQVMTVTIPVEEWGIEPDSLYCLNEFIGNTHSWLTGAQLSTITTSIDAKKARVYSISDSAIILNIEPMEREIPYRYELSQSYPNPFNDECVIKFSVPIQIKVNITVYNILGQKVRLLSDAIWETGVHTIKWDGKSETGGVLSSGMYFYRMQAGDFVATRKVIIIK
jgi:hypothetical protein